MFAAFVVTACILTFNRFYGIFYSKNYRALNEAVVRRLVDEAEVVPAADLLRKNILRNVIIDLLFIMKGPGLLLLRGIYEKEGLFEQDICDLRSRAWHRRLAALVRLDRWQSDLPFEEIAPLLEDENKTVLNHAMKTLSLSAGGDWAVTVLKHLARRRVDLAIRYECLSRLLRNHRALVLSDMTPEVLKVLGDKRDIAAVPLIIDAAIKGDDEIRECAFKALGKIGDPRAISLLLGGIEERKGSVRLAALRALHELDDSLLTVHKSTLLNDSDPLVRAWTAHLLRKHA